MSSAGGGSPWQAMVSVRTSIVPPRPRLPPADTPDASAAAMTPQVKASIHDFAVPLRRWQPLAWPRWLSSGLLS
jgi:hypothetical protein